MNSKKLSEKILEVCPSNFLDVAKLLLDKIDLLEEKLSNTKSNIEEVVVKNDKVKNK